MDIFLIFGCLGIACLIDAGIRADKIRRLEIRKKTPGTKEWFAEVFKPGAGLDYKP